MGKMAHMVDFMKLIDFDDDLHHTVDDVEHANNVYEVNEEDANQNGENGEDPPHQ